MGFKVFGFQGLWVLCFSGFWVSGLYGFTVFWVSRFVGFMICGFKELCHAVYICVCIYAYSVLAIVLGWVL